MLEKLKLEYVESAWIILYQLTNSDTKLLNETKDLFLKNLNFVLDKVDHKNLIFSGLFNAYTEDKIVDRLKTVVDFHNTNGLHAFQYADSGGLQIVNTGAEINDAIKDKIYKYQAENSNLAFSFDEIPAFKSGWKTRTYVEEWVEPYGLKAGQNLKKHIATFKELKSNAKLIPIVQGANAEQLNIYTKALLSQIDISEMSEIEALACGGGGNGIGILNNFISLQNLDVSPTLKRHTHLLGSSGIDRLAPILTLIRNGLVPHIERLSFDSSFHTSSYVYGDVQRSTDHLKNSIKIHRLGLNKNLYVRARFNELVDFWKDSETFNFKNLDDVFKHSIYGDGGINSPARQLKEHGEEAYLKNVNLIQMYILFNIYKYLRLLFDFIEDRISFYEICHNDKYSTVFSGLTDIKTLDEYYDWFKLASNKYKFARANIVSTFDEIKKSPSDLLF